MYVCVCKKSAEMKCENWKKNGRFEKKEEGLYDHITFYFCAEYPCPCVAFVYTIACMVQLVMVPLVRWVVISFFIGAFDHFCPEWSALDERKGEKRQRGGRKIDCDGGESA